MQVNGPPRGMARPKRMWMEVVKIDLKKCNLSEDLAQNRSEWRNRIHIANPTYLGQGSNDDDDDDVLKAA